MGTIKINNIVYGSNNASDIVYKSTTVEEKLDTIPIFDINDNGNVDNSGSDVLTYGYIVNSLNSSAVDKTLSANQGKVLKELIDDVDSEVNTLNSTLSSDINTVSDRVESTRSEIENFMRNDLINIIYPIGSIYMSVNNVSPASFLGGTWEQIKDRFLLAAGSSYSAGSTGGAATVTTAGTVNGHTLTVNEMPSHSHTNYYAGGSGVSWGYNYSSSGGTISSATAASGGIGNTGGGQAHSHTFTGSSINNMPPYLTVYIWKRIS